MGYLHHLINHNLYDVNMQQNDKILDFKIKFGVLLKDIREKNYSFSRSRFAREYDLDRGNLSRIENGKISCSIVTTWKICNALGIKFSDFAKLLEEELGEDFKLIDE